MSFNERISNSEKKNLVREHTNITIVSSFGAAVFGFLLAIYSGGYAEAEFKEIPPWLALIVSVASTAISAYAVYLVSKTLKATQDTLSVTQQMAEAQKEAFRTEYRPLVLIEAIEINEFITASPRLKYHGDAELKIKITYRNYGKTTALKIESGVFAGPIEKEELVKLEFYNIFIGYGNFYKPALRPEREFTDETYICANFSNEKKVLLGVSILFHDESGRVGTDPENIYYIIEKEDIHCKIREAKRHEVEHPDYD